MKSTSIISKAIATLLIIFGMVTFLSAQTPTPPTSPSTSRSKTKSTSTSSSSKSSQKININMNGNKLRLKMDDEEFDLDMVFDFDATDVIAAITEELGSPFGAGSFKVWEGRGYDIKVKDSHLDVYINRNKVSSSTERQMENILTVLFADLDLDIEINN